MSLTVVSVPIGHPKDITLRALDTLKNAELVICEERRVAETWLKKWSIFDKELKELNEHSKPQDIESLVKICQAKNVALISDAGTPGFCDPGSDLVSLCIKKNVSVTMNPGASSLMALLAVIGRRLDEFLFVGFLPAEKTSRAQKINSLSRESRPLIVMDTPYRLEATLKDMASVFGSRFAILGKSLTCPEESISRGPLESLASQRHGKHPFVLVLLEK